MSTSQLGVVTVTYNAELFLPEFIRCCHDQNTPEFRIYCIDNASQDQTRSMLRSVKDDRWRITLNTTNVGVAEGNNQGIQQALKDRCEWVLLLNNDTSFPRNFFAQLTATAVARRWGVLVPKIHYDKPAGHIWYGGGGFNRGREYSVSHYGKGQRDIGQCDAERTVDYAPTCAMLLSEAVIERVGLMDESYFVYFDDTDYCWRLRQQGIPINYWPNLTLVHKVGGSTGGSTSEFTVRMTARNRLYYLRKHFGAWRACFWMPIFLAYYVARFVFKEWNPACFRASIGGMLSYRSMSPRVPSASPERGGFTCSKPKV